MAKYEQYAEYKDSGVEWLGEIPTKWKVTALKRYCNVKGGYAFASDTFSNAGEPVIRIGDIKADGSISLEGCKFISTELAKSSHAYLVEKGQLLMAMTGATIGKAGVYINDRPAYLNQRVGKFVIDNDEMNYSFLWYTLKTNGYQEYIKLTAFGGAQPNISDTGMVDYISCFPSLSEQTQIANFLDHETAQIDTLIEKQQTLIQLLKEKRQAVISHAVTKGLNPDAPMKDSGVEWLGEVPEGWKVTKLGFHTSKIGSGKTPRGGAEVYQEEGILFIRSQNVYDNGLRVDKSESVFISEAIHEEMSNTKVQGGDVLLNVTGGSIGRTCIVPNNFIEANVNQHVCIVRLPISMRYFIAFVLKSSLVKEQIDSIQTGGNREGLNFEQISKFIICLPPEEERADIVSYIESETKKIDSLLEQSNNAIQLMQERRTALISAAVTGKIDVRGWVAPESKTTLESL